MLTNFSQFHKPAHIKDSGFSFNQKLGSSQTSSIKLKLLFAGLRDLQPVVSPDPVNVLGEYQCDTFFFRDLRILDMMKGYLQKHFPNGTHIANFGCSNGEETRTIDMLLQEINADKRYTITGYDPVPIRIQEARKGQYGIGLNLDRFLTQTEDSLRDRGKVLKRLFDQFFRPAYFKNHDYEDVFEAKKNTLILY